MSTCTPWKRPLVQCYLAAEVRDGRAGIALTLVAEAQRDLIDEVVDAATVLDAHAVGVLLALRALRRPVTLHGYVRTRELAEALRDPELGQVDPEVADAWRDTAEGHEEYLFDVEWRVTLNPDGPHAAGVRECEARAAALIGSL